ncbi:lysine histidine transporter-like 5 [Phtheirospermum japonicum]|uniref:Lysine histidine transporter-like 5 n=1 Tax=Phtheirospermum japonicum TaxID=374723 RepID=A0A830CNQ3_9LAMI|nr:lysine histidine transporter-like 5 [Phtheirospermum japonicum]
MAENNNEAAKRDLNSFLPITASRKGKWWYSAFHNVTAMVGAGVLGLPLVLARLGWIPGITIMTMSWLVTWYTVWQLIQLHESDTGQRFDRYTELGQHAFGPKLGIWVVMPQQLVVQIGSNIVYMVTGGKSLKKCLSLMTPEADFRKTYYILIFACLHLILSQCPNFNSLKVISLTAALMSIGYSMIATGASIAKGVAFHHIVDYGFKAKTTPGIVFDIFSSLGVLAFAFAGHSVALEIQATIPSTQDKPSRRPMWSGVKVAYLIVGMCYFPVAISGFWAFGNEVEDDVLLSLEDPNWLISLANFMVFVHVLGSYQVFAMPVFDKIEGALIQNWDCTPGRRLRLIARSIYVVFTGYLVPFGLNSVNLKHGAFIGLHVGQVILLESGTIYWRRVREALTELDLSVEIFPCPKGSVRHREMVRRLGGREQFPFLVDPNTGTSMYESSDIVKYLFQQYGGKKSSPSFGMLESTLLTGWVPTLLRAGRGMTLWENAVKELPRGKLELFSYENNPNARIVREALCELELPYILQNVGRGSTRAKLLYEISGSNEVPYLIDGNTGVKIGDYKKIVSYLFQTYSFAST